jgi:hypothetical protein
MSYSFSFQCATKHEARSLAREHFNEVVNAQPVHVQDREIALEALDLYLGALVDDDTRDIMVNMHGAVSYSWMPDVDAEKVPLTHASVGVSAHFVSRG